MENMEVPDILRCILASEDYVESDLVLILQDLLEVSETAYVQAFLQFIISCAELDIHVTTETCFSSVLLRTGPEPVQFLCYRDPRLEICIDDFLRGYLADGKAFELPLWTGKVLELLQALVNAGGQFAVCGLYFVMRLLINGYCIHGMDLPSGSSNVLRFCQNLFGLYEYNLIKDDNWNDVAQKLNYIFQFYWPQVMSGSDAGNIRHLSALLFINNNNLRKDVLRTIILILESPTATVNIRKAVFTELVNMKDIVIAFCHLEPLVVSLPALTLIFAHSDELLADKNDQEKIFLLMCIPRPKLQEMARGIFLKLVAQSDEIDKSHAFLSAVEQLALKYQLVFENVDNIVGVLMDHFPSFVDVYLYIIQNNSHAISRISSILIQQMIEKSKNLSHLQAALTDVANLSCEALEQLSGRKEWNIYQDILTNIQSLPDAIFGQISASKLQSFADHLLMVMREPNLNKNLLSIGVALWLKIEEITTSGTTFADIMVRLNDKWAPIGLFLESWNAIDNNELTVLKEKVDQEMRYFPDNDLELMNVKHLLLLRNTDHQEVLVQSLDLLRSIEDKYFGALEEFTRESTFAELLRIIVQIILNLIRLLHGASDNQLTVLYTFGEQLMDWITNRIQKFPNEVGGHQYVINLLEFTWIWMDIERFSQFLAAVSRSTESSSLIAKIFASIDNNRFFPSDTKFKQLSPILSATLHALNNGSRTTAASKRILSSVIDQFKDSSVNVSEILVTVLVDLLSKTSDNLPNSQMNNLHRFKSLDALAERLPANISPANRRIVSTLVGDILCLELIDAEKATLHKIISSLQ